MQKRLTAAVVSGAVAVGGLGLGLVALPVIASAATASPTAEASQDAVDAVGDRLGRIRDALDGLVSDGTLDEAQADTVAETLDEALPERGPGHGGPGGPGGPGGRGGGLALEEAASLVGLEVDELLVELQEGQSLAAVAEAQGVDEATLVDGLVTATEDHVAEHLADGDITQEQADQRLAGLEERITVLVEREDLPLRDGHGFRGGADDDATDDATDDSTDDATPAPSDDATTETTSLTA